MTELTISISELRNRFDEYMRRLKLGEVIVVTKYGKPIAQFTPAKMRQEKQKLLSAPKRQKKGSSN
jgi:prevent-host-death family protein